MYITLSVYGVDDCKVIRCPRGSGSIDVVIAVKTGCDPDTVRTDVENKINEKIGTARDVRIIFAIEVFVLLDVTFKGTATENQVRAEFESFFAVKKIGVSKDIASLIEEVKKNLPGKLTSLLINPNEDFEVTGYEVLVFDKDSTIVKAA